MPKITEETLVQRLCDPKQYEDALLEIKTTLDTVAGSSIVHEAFRALHAAIASLSEAAAARDERLRAEAAVEALERVAQSLRDSVNKTEVPKGDIGVAAERLTMARIAVNCAAEAARLRGEAGR